jgi:hypothetical protein
MKHYTGLSLVINVLYMHMQVKLEIVYGFSNDLSLLLSILVSLHAIWVFSQEKCLCYIKKITSCHVDVQYEDHRNFSIKHHPYIF